MSYNHHMKTESVIINDKEKIREVEKKLEEEHIEALKQVDLELQSIFQQLSTEDRSLL